MKKRWASDVGAGCLVTALGLLAAGLSLLFALPIVVPAFGVATIGVAIALFGAFEYFVSSRATQGSHAVD